MSALESITVGALTMLEAIRFVSTGIAPFHASFRECFGDVGMNTANEYASVAPRVQAKPQFT
jgi:GDP-D-mannose dehydratase